MSEQKTDTVEDLLESIIKSTEKILIETNQETQHEKVEGENLPIEEENPSTENPSTENPSIENPSSESLSTENPSYGPAVNALSYWEISKPIYLTNVIYNDLKINTESIYLSKGFYKFSYTFSNVNPPGGIGIFDTDKKELIRLIAYQSYYGGQGEKVVRFSGTEYFKTDKDVVIGVTNGFGNFRPASFRGIVSVTVHKLRNSPV